MSCQKDCKVPLIQCSIIKMIFDPTKNVEVSQLWPTYLYRTVVDNIDNEKISEWILNYKKTTESRNLTNQGGWQANIDNHQDEPIFKNYIETILQTLRVTKLKITEETKLSITSWANVNEKGDWNFVHDHVGTDLSGVYYVKVPEDSGEIVFFDPRKISIVASAFEEDQPKAFGYHLVEGTLLLFPSYLEHMVTPSKSNENRISIAFNVCVDS